MTIQLAETVEMSDLNQSILDAAAVLSKISQLPGAGDSNAMSRPTSLDGARSSLGLNNPLFGSGKQPPKGLDLVGVCFMQSVTHTLMDEIADMAGVVWSLCPEATCSNQAIIQTGFVLHDHTLIRIDLDIPPYDGDDFDCEATFQFFAVKPGCEDTARAMAEDTVIETDQHIAEVIQRASGGHTVKAVEGEHYSYALVRVMPDLRRGEWVNVGVCVFLPDRLDIRLADDLGKVTALAPTFDLALVSKSQQDWSALTTDMDPNDRHGFLSRLIGVYVSPLAWFTSTSDDYERNLRGIMRDLVEVPS